MPAKKRSLEDAAATPKAKKSKLAVVDKSSKKSKEKGKVKEKAEPPLQPTSNLISEEVDFPRGGGTTLTPLEVKAIRAEGLKEAEDELFKVRHSISQEFICCSQLTRFVSRSKLR